MSLLLSRREALVGAVALSPLVPLIKPAFARLLLTPTAGSAFSPDGSIIAADSGSPSFTPTGATLTNAYGVWGFGPVSTLPTGSGDPNLHSKFYYVTLNGEIVAVDNVPQAQGILIDFGGNVFFLTTQNDRWVFQMQGYNASAHLVGADVPDASFTGAISGNVLTASSVSGTILVNDYVVGTGVVTAQITSFGSGSGGAGTYNLAGSPQIVTAEPMFSNPSGGVGPWFIVPGAVVSEPSLHYVPQTASPDGTTISGGTGTVSNRYGIWSFGSGSTDWPIKLNGVVFGVPPGGGNVTQIKIDKNGNIFALSTNTNWYVYLSFWWFLVGPSIPGGPIPTFVTLTPTLTTAITTSSPNGTVITSIAVQMSDGSGFAGSLSGGGPAFAGISGSNVVVISTPTIGGAGFEVTATQNGVSVFSGASTVGIGVLS